MRECAHCGLTYAQLRTGYTYQDIYSMFWSGDANPTTWVNKRRNTILGRWHEIKQSMWDAHLEMCELQSQYELAVAADNLQGVELGLSYPVTANVSDDMSVPF